MKAYLSIGTNEGDRYLNLQEALSCLNHASEIIIKTKSSIYETEAWGVVDQALFLNMVVEIDTVLDPSSLLQVCQDIENKLGRQRVIHWGPRKIDIDILLYAGFTIQTEELIIPHPYMEMREFVLSPLREIAPELILPSGRPVGDVRGEGKVKKYFLNRSL